MPALTLTPYQTYAVTYTSALDITEDVWNVFRGHERDANIMYPYAQKMRLREEKGYPPLPGQVWIACFTSVPGGSPRVDFVLSCTDGPMGTYPAFIFANHPYSSLQDSFARPRIDMLAQALHAAIPPERVYSVFGPESVAKAFASAWTRHSGIRLEADPEYYAAKFSFCTKASFVPRQATIHPEFSYNMRLAEESDTMAAAELCHGFASTSAPFTLTQERAIKEAQILIANKQLWVHEVSRSGFANEIASIVAVTRRSAGVAAITKVYTNPRWRQRGCAERLVRHVTKRLLNTEGTKSVVLFVAHDNPAAAKVYHRVGFQGLNGSKMVVEGVDPWLELGFDRKSIQLGHW